MDSVTLPPSSAASSSANVRIDSAISSVSVTEARKPCTASRPSVIAAAACSIVLASVCFASLARCGKSSSTAWNLSSTP